MFFRLDNHLSLSFKASSDNKQAFDIGEEIRNKREKWYCSQLEARFNLIQIPGNRLSAHIILINFI